MAKGRISTQVLKSSNDGVVPNSQQGVKTFLAGVEDMSDDERAVIVEQAIMLLEGFHVNLPLKCAMYAVDPLRRLKLLLQRLPTVFRTDRLFHREMTQIFNSLHDLHTTYILPAPYADATASLPFSVEFCYEGKRPTYLATKIVGQSFAGTAFCEGVEIMDWNGVPISRAVEMAGAQSPYGAGNVSARHAVGVYSLTARPLKVLPPPDEEWVIVGYRTRAGGKRHEIQTPWSVSLESKIDKRPRRGSMVTGGIQDLRKLRFAPKVKGPFLAKKLPTTSGTFGYLRIYNFENIEVDDLIAQVEPLPRNGLIIDLRENNGGRIPVAEQFLQVISPNYPQHRIEPERLCFINTPRTLQLCKLQAGNLSLGPSGLGPWIDSIQRAMDTGATYSASFPFTDPESCNVKGRLRYPGPVIIVTDGLTLSAAEFLAAGFQDHGGKILGVDEVTGGAGANVRSHTELSEYFEEEAGSPFKPLPKKADIKVPIRRCQRVGPQSGHEIEDFGVKRDYSYRMTRNDLLNRNEDLINYAASILVKDMGARGRST
jgi:C-terminal processing protease CtpA/Prc